MLSRELMAIACLALLWTTALLVAAAAMQSALDLARRLRRLRCRQKCDRKKKNHKSPHWGSLGWISRFSEFLVAFSGAKAFWVLLPI